MENKPDQIWKNAMNYGAIGGSAIFLLKLILSLSGLSFSALSYLSGIIFIIVIIIGTKNLRDKLYDGYIKYLKGVYSGILISVFMGIITGFYLYLDYSFINPQNMETFLKNQEETMMAFEPLLINFNYIEEGELDEILEKIYEEASPLNFAFAEIESSFIKGFFLSLIIGAFLKREKPLSNKIIQNTDFQ